MNLKNHSLSEIIFDGFNFEIYYAKHKKTDTKYLLKKYKKNTIFKENNNLLNIHTRFKRELDILTSLEHKNLPSLISYNGDDDKRHILLKNTGISSLNKLLEKKTLSLDNQINLLVQILDVLEFLHNRNIIHGHVHPDNLFITEQNEIILLDQSLALTLDEVFQLPDDFIYGIFPFLSPEQLGFTDYKVDTRSDLYCCGLILYKWLSGEMPYSKTLSETSFKSMLELVLKTEIKPIKNIPKLLNMIILKSLRPNPDDRYQTATGFKYDLNLFLKDFNNEKKESFFIGQKDNLIAVNRFQIVMGREEELRTLEDSFYSFINGGNVSIAMIGPSGIGKSTVIHEFKKMVLNDDVFNLEVKCNRFNAIQPYSVLKELIDEFIFQINHKEFQLKNKITDIIRHQLAEYSGTICKIIPNFSIFFKNLTTVESFDEDKESELILYSLYKVINVLSEYIQIIFIIDDFQWIDEKSYKIIKTLINDTSNIFQLCCIRIDDQDKAFIHRDPVQDIGYSQSIYLKPLSIIDIERLLEKKFSLDFNNNYLATILKEKTNGIPLILTEALRYLVNNSFLVFQDNQWVTNDKNIQSLPDTFDPVYLINKKIESLESRQISFLQAASIVDEDFDEIQISEITEINLTNIKTIVIQLINEGLIKKKFLGTLSFAHDEIKRVIKQNIDTPFRASLTLRLAQWYESKSQVDKDYLFKAANCFLKTDDLNKAIDLCVKAGDLATERRAFDSALKFYKNANMMLSAPEDLNLHPDIIQIQIKNKLAHVLLLIGSHDQALNIYKNILNSETGLTSQETNNIKFTIGSIYRNMGNFQESIKYFNLALLDLGLIFPTSKIGIYRYLGRELLLQLFYSCGLRKILNLRNDTNILLKIKILNQLSYTLFFEDLLSCFLAHFISLNFSDRVAISFEKVETYAIHTVPSFQMFLKKRAFSYFQKSTHMSKSLNRNDIYPYCLSFGALIHFYNGMWKKALELSDSSIQHYKRVGDLWSQLRPIETKIFAHLQMGQLGKAKEASIHAMEISEKCSDLRGKIVSNWIIALIHFYELNDSDEEWTQLQDDVDKLNDCLIKAMVDLSYAERIEKLGNISLAFQLMESLIVEIQHKKMNQEYISRAYNVQCHILLMDLLKPEGTPSSLQINSNEIYKKINKYMKNAFFFAMLYPANKPLYLANKALLFFLKKQFKKSKKTIFQSIQLSHSIGMRNDEARNYLHHALLMEKLNFPGEAQDSYNKAFQIFQSIGNQYESNLIKNKITIIDSEPSTHGESIKNDDHQFLPEIIRTNTLFEAAKKIYEIRDIDILLRQILSSLIKTTGSEFGYLFLESNPYHSAKSLIINYEDNEINMSNFSFSKNIIQNVKKNQEIVIIKDASSIESEENKIRSVLCTPILRGTRYLGFIYLSNNRITGLFTENSKKAVLLLRFQAEILLENTYLMESQKKLNFELKKRVNQQTMDILSKNKQLEEYNLKLIESERVKNMLTGTVVHDIKNYTAGIEGNLNVIMRRYHTDQKTLRNLNHAFDSCNDIISLSSNLIDIGKMEEEKVRLKLQLVGFSFFQNCFEKASKNVLFTEKEIQLSYLVPDVEFLLPIDTYLIERVIQNLFNNAAKYTPDRGNVKITFEVLNDSIQLLIFNSGEPIDTSLKNILFEKYSRIEEKRSPYSKGLGLFFCKMVLEAHGGRIWVEPEENGNFFKLELERKKL